MTIGCIAPAKPSHLINVVEFQRKASEEGNRHECSDVASEEGARGSKLGMIAGSGASAQPCEASELPRPPEALQKPDGPQGTADAAEPTSAAGVPAGTIGTQGAAEEKKETRRNLQRAEAAAVDNGKVVPSGKKAAAKVERVKDRIASLMDSGCVPAFKHAIDDLVQLVGDSEAANALANISKEKIGEGNNEKAASAVGWLKIIQKRTRGKLSPTARKAGTGRAKGARAPGAQRAEPCSP